jgi:hypothetical protein
LHELFLTCLIKKTETVDTYCNILIIFIIKFLKLKVIGSLLFIVKKVIFILTIFEVFFSHWQLR